MLVLCPEASTHVSPELPVDLHTALLTGTEDEHTQKGLNKDGHNCLESQCVVRMHSSFDHQGVNGSHLVMVFEVCSAGTASMLFSPALQSAPTLSGSIREALEAH